jgi:hypothetical protein
MADGGQLKLSRAREQIVEARTIARSWLDSDTFTIVRATNPDTGRTEARVRLQGSPPDELSLAVGDAIHNMRAALDHAVFDAAYRNTGGSLTEKEERALAFPILDAAPPQGFANRNVGMLPHVPADVRQVIEEVQPYGWNDASYPDGFRFHPLWRIHDLDRIDKHRRLTVMAASLGHHGIGVPHGVEPDQQFHVASGPVEDGQVLATYLGAEKGVEYVFDLDVVLVEGGIPDEPAVDTMLEGLLRYVEWVVWRVKGASRNTPVGSS